MKTAALFLAATALALAPHAIAKKSGPGCNVTAAGMARSGKTDPWNFNATVQAKGLAAGQSCQKLELATDDGRVIHTQPLAGEGEIKFQLPSIPEGVAVIHVRAVSTAGAVGRVSKLKVPGARKK